MSFPMYLFIFLAANGGQRVLRGGTVDVDVTRPGFSVAGGVVKVNLLSVVIDVILVSEETVIISLVIGMCLVVVMEFLVSSLVAAVWVIDVVHLHVFDVTSGVLLVTLVSVVQLMDVVLISGVTLSLSLMVIHCGGFPVVRGGSSVEAVLRSVIGGVLSVVGLFFIVVHR